MEPLPCIRVNSTGLELLVGRRRKDLDLQTNTTAVAMATKHVVPITMAITSSDEDGGVSSVADDSEYGGCCGNSGVVCGDTVRISSKKTTYYCLLNIVGFWMTKWLWFIPNKIVNSRSNSSANPF